MRLESCIRKGLGLKAHRVAKIREQDGWLVAEVERCDRRLLHCGECGRPAIARSTSGPMRQWRDLPVRNQPLAIEYAPFEVRCSNCGLRTEKLPWADKWQRITNALALAIATLSRELSWSKAAEHFGVDWKTVAAAVKRAVARGLKLRRWKPLHMIGIDEVSRAKGQRYLTLVYDLERRRLVWIGQDRGTETMNAFFAWLGWRRGRSIKVVCCDMWAVYIDAVQKRLSHAQLVFDRFHVVQHLSRAVDDVRREAWRKLDGTERSAFKATRWLWLKNPWNLRDDESRRLSALCRKNTPIVRAYYLKEAFQRFWDYLYEGWAAPYLQWWLRWASRSRLAPFVRFARMIRNHLDGILAWTKLRVANGALEGMNNKVKVVSHRAFGYRTVETYITAIWHACGDLPLS